jgi:hypothetical protein
MIDCNSTARQPFSHTAARSAPDPCHTAARLAPPCWVNLRILGQPCEFLPWRRLPLFARSRPGSRTAQTPRQGVRTQAAAPPTSSCSTTSTFRWNGLAAGSLRAGEGGE